MEINLTDEQAEKIVPLCVDFMRVLNDELGAEPALQVWENITNGLGDDIKGRVFIAMLSDYGGTNVTLTALRGRYYNFSNNEIVSNPLIYGFGHNKVAAIKCIRNYTGMGLKDTKEVMDDMEKGKQVGVKCTNWKYRTAFVRELNILGIDSR
jgi:hypothetical protein